VRADGCTWRGNEPKYIFGDEKGANDLEPVIECSGPDLAPDRHCIGEHDADSCGEHDMVHSAK
jgi:hypothetical protein